MNTETGERSQQKDGTFIDGMVAHYGVPFVLFVGRQFVRPMLRNQPNPADRNEFFLQERIGANGEPFWMVKFRTMPEGSDQPFGRFAGFVRKLGLDEAGQFLNILVGDMSLLDYRALPDKEYQAVMEGASPEKRTKFIQKVRPRKPGIVNRFSTDHHQQPGISSVIPDEFIDSAVERVEQGSVLYHLGTAANYVKKAITGRL